MLQCLALFQFCKKEQSFSIHQNKIDLFRNQYNIYYQNIKTLISNQMHQEQQEAMPPLMPIKKKKDPHSIHSIHKQPNDQISKTPPTKQKTPEQTFQKLKNPQPATNNQKTQERQQTKSQHQGQQKKIQQFSNKFKNLHQHSANTKKATKKSEEQKQKQNEKSKFLIAEMLNKISVKNISEQLYPISNETIQSVLHQLQNEIKELSLQADKKQNTLFSNPNNQHLKNQIANLKKSIDHCVTIKELYHQKINFRNKIAILQGKMMDLRAQNRDLKIKVNRGIQKIQNHMHNLPCQRQKQLSLQLATCTTELKQQKQMRQNLQKNIQDIIMNFKRLYDEADTARLIVTRKLRQIQDRQRKLFEQRNQLFMEAEQDQSNSFKKSPKIDAYEDKRSQKQQEDKTQKKGDYRQAQRGQIDRTDRDRQKQYMRTDRTNDRQRRTIQMQKKQAQKKPLSFEDSIKKMRGNQSILSRIHNKG